MFFDTESKETYPVCVLPNCQHNDRHCNAFIGYSEENEEEGIEEQYLLSTVYYYNGYVYLLNTNGMLTRFAPDGSERTPIANVYVSENRTGPSLVFYGDYVYYYDTVPTSVTDESTARIVRYSLDGKKSDVVLETSGNGKSFYSVKSYGDWLLFNTRALQVKPNESTGMNEVTSTFDGLYAYNHKTGETGKLIDAQVADFCADEEKQEIYYQVLNDGIYKYNIKTKSNDKIAAYDENFALVNMSYDGNYIYVDNRLWKTTLARTGKNIDAICRVISTDGKVVNELALYECVSVYGGDSDYLFICTNKKDSNEVANDVYFEKNNIKNVKQYKNIK